MRGLLSDVSYQWDLLAWDILSITRLVITDKIFHLVGWPDLLHSVHLGQCRGSGGSIKLAQLSILEGNEAFGYQVLSSHTRTSSNYIYPLSYPGWKIKVKCWKVIYVSTWILWDGQYNPLTTWPEMVHCASRCNVMQVCPASSLPSQWDF